ncbi:MAG TPA: hypothetical protein VIX59_02435, partial [Candidatus Binataceae bacterium]
MARIELHSASYRELPAQGTQGLISNSSTAKVSRFFTRKENRDVYDGKDESFASIAIQKITGL